jgi:preprotein translocase subunit YajC
MPALFAQEPAPLPKQQADVSPFGGGFPLLMIAGLALFWVIVVLPADRRRRKDQEKMLAELKPGAKVVTTGGLVGVVVTANPGDDEITVRSADAKLRVLRSSVSRVLGDEAPAAGK